MYNSVNENNSFENNTPELDMAQLQKLLRQQAQRRPLFENITILGCGYVGSALAYYWQDRGHFVTGTTTSWERVASLSELVSQVVLLKGDDADAMQSIVQGQDTIVVSVAPTSSAAADEDGYSNTYLATAKNLVKALEQASRVKQIIYLSSCSVYGDRQGAWVDENSTIMPQDRNSQVLYEAEQTLMQANRENRKVSILRLGGIYGPGRELISMYGGLAGMTLPGKGDRVINWTHRDDIVKAIEFARLNELEGIYNLVDDSQLTVREQVERVCYKYSLPPVYWDSSQLGRRGNSARISNQKLKAAGYELIYPQLQA
ncbi:MAG: SDR family oxidoreductase [Xenococcus sp. (in: cyanobacteria)]